MSLGDLIYTARKEKGMTMQELGKAVGVQASAVNKWEKGIVSNIKRRTLVKIADVLDINKDVLISEAFKTAFDHEAFNEAQNLYDEFTALTPANQAVVKAMMKALKEAQEK